MKLPTTILNAIRNEDLQFENTLMHVHKLHLTYIRGSRNNGCFNRNLLMKCTTK
jgi:hypothetical protein